MADRFAGGQSAAARWNWYAASYHAISTHILPSTLPGHQNEKMLHVTTDAGGSDISQEFCPHGGPAHAQFSVWVYAVEGTVGADVGNGGAAGSHALDSTPGNGCSSRVPSRFPPRTSLLCRLVPDRRPRVLNRPEAVSPTCGSDWPDKEKGNRKHDSRNRGERRRDGPWSSGWMGRPVAEAVDGRTTTGRHHRSGVRIG